EARWEPICSSAFCEGTRTGKLKVKVSLHAENGAPKEWKKEMDFSPTVELSQAVLCARDGRVWAGAECLSHEEAAQRRLASNPRAMGSASAGHGAGAAGGDSVPEVNPEQEVICPSYI